MYRKLTPQMLSPYVEIEHRRKDQIINELENELRTLVSLEDVLLARNQQILGIESRYTTVIDEMEVLEAEFKKSIGQKTQQISRFKKDIREMEAEYVTLKQEFQMSKVRNLPKRQILDTKAQEVEAALLKILDLEGQNRKIIQANIATSKMVKELKGKKELGMKENVRIANEVKSAMMVLDGKRQERQKIEVESRSLKQKLLKLIEDVRSKQLGVNTEQRQLLQSTLKLQAAQQLGHDLDTNLINLSGSIQSMQSQSSNLQNAVSLLTKQNKQNSLTIKQLQSNLRQIDTSMIFQLSKNQQLNSSVSVYQQKERVLDEQIKKMEMEKSLVERRSLELEKIMLGCRAADQKIMSIVERTVSIDKLLGEVTALR